MRTTPFPADLFKEVHPHHEVLLSCKPHRPRCHQWRPAHKTLAEEVRQLNADVIVEYYLDPKYYQDCDIHQITGARIVRIQADASGEFNKQKLKGLCFNKNMALSFSPVVERRCRENV